MMFQRHRIVLLASALAGLVVATASVAQATTITIVNLDGAGEGFNDPTAAAPVGGNSGTTIGAQRLNVFTHAADIWAARISSTIEIKVEAGFNPLSCTSTSGVLGSAGPNTAQRDFSGALVASTWYPGALANALAGTDLDPGINDIGATFNSAIGTPGCLTLFPWYYGLDGNPPANSIELLSVILHEIGHGLGFLTFVSLGTGAKFLGLDDVFMRNLENHGATPPDYPSMTNAQRVTASKATGNLHWVGAAVQAAASGTLSAGTVGTHVRMYAPSSQQGGSSVSHWDTALVPNQLMEPFATVPFSEPVLEIPLFQDIGWPLAAAGPNIGVAPSSENYGHVTAGNASDQIFTVTNIGTATLHVSSTSIVDLGATTGASEFTVQGGVNAFDLAPSDSTTVTVRFEPAAPAGAKSATLRFASDDADTPNRDIPLSGTAQVPAHDLAVVKITAPGTVSTDPGVPVTRAVKVQFQNRSDHFEVLPDETILGDGKTTGLVLLSVAVVDDDGETCQPAVVALDTAKNAKLFKNGLPNIVKPKGKLTINYRVTYRCNNVLPKNNADATPGDYSHTAIVFHSELGGEDTHPEDDVCPHDALATPGNRDPNPDGKIVDKGCGTKKPDNTIGGPVLTNVTRK